MKDYSDGTSVQTDDDKVCLFPLHKIMTLKEAASWLGISRFRLVMLMLLGGGPKGLYRQGWRQYIRKSDVDDYAKLLFERAGLPSQYYVEFRQERNESDVVLRHPFIEMASRDEIHRVAISFVGKILLLLGLGTIIFSHSPWLHLFF